MRRMPAAPASSHSPPNHGIPPRLQPPAQSNRRNRSVLLRRREPIIITQKTPVAGARARPPLAAIQALVLVARILPSSDLPVAPRESQYLHQSALSPNVRLGTLVGSRRVCQQQTGTPSHPLRITYATTLTAASDKPLF